MCDSHTLDCVEDLGDRTLGETARSECLYLDSDLYVSEDVVKQLDEWATAKSDTGLEFSRKETVT